MTFTDSQDRSQFQNNPAKERIAVSHRLISADRVQGSAVYSADGEKLGHIEAVMLDKMSGRVAYAILSFGGFLGAGERFHPLPWSVLTYDADQHGYRVPLSKAQLAEAPSVERSEIELQDDNVWGAKVHEHFGVPAPFI